MAILDDVESQLQSHFSIAVNTGLTETHLRSLITVRVRVGEDQGDRAAESSTTCSPPNTASSRRRPLRTTAPPGAQAP